MRATAQLAGERLVLGADRDDTDGVAVLLAEQGDGAGGLGLLDAHHAGDHGLGGEDLLVHEVLDGADLLRGHGLEVGEVETQGLRGDERAGLVHMVAQDLLEGSVEQMGRGVVAREQAAAVEVVAGKDGVTLGELADELALVDIQAALGNGVGDEELGVGSVDEAVVAQLTAHLGVQRGAIEHDGGLGGVLGGRHALTVHNDGENMSALDALLLVTGELGGRELVGELGPNVVEGTPSVTLGGGAGAGLLLGHLGVEALDVDGMAGGLGDLDGEVDRETEGVVQHEGGLAGELLALAQGAELLVEVDATVVERGGEALLLGVHDALDQTGVLDEVGIGIAHDVVHRIDEAAEERVLDAEQAAVEHGTTQQTAQDVTAALVAGQDAVGDEEVDGTGVVGDDAQGAGGAGVLVIDVGLTGDLLAQLDEALHDVAVEEGALVLHDGGHALEAHAGIEVAVGQLGHGAVLLAIELREHEVPELQEAIAIAAGGAVGAAAADLLAEVEVNLGAGAAGTGGAGSPEVVVLAEAGDVVLGNAEGAPDVMRLVVVSEDGEVQTLLWKLEDLGDQLVGPGACLLLGHTAKGEVAEHLEERGVTAVGADDVDVVGAHALLARAGTDLLHDLLALVVLLELVHTGVGEKQRGVVGDEGRAGIQLVATLLEEVEIGRANLGGRHGGIVSGHA